MQGLQLQPLPQPARILAPLPSRCRLRQRRHACNSGAPYGPDARDVGAALLSGARFRCSSRRPSGADVAAASAVPGAGAKPSSLCANAPRGMPGSQRRSRAACRSQGSEEVPLVIQPDPEETQQAAMQVRASLTHAAKTPKQSQLPGCMLLSPSRRDMETWRLCVCDSGSHTATCDSIT